MKIKSFQIDKLVCKEVPLSSFTCSSLSVVCWYCCCYQVRPFILSPSILHYRGMDGFGACARACAPPPSRSAQSLLWSVGCNHNNCVAYCLNCCCLFCMSSLLVCTKLRWKTLCRGDNNVVTAVPRRCALASEVT